MRCVIMQPTFLPWSGYFNLISQADEFVFLDDVQYEKRSWQSRNAILLGGRRYLISLQINKGDFNQKINEVILFQDSNWRTSLEKTLVHTYGKHAFPQAIQPVLQALQNNKLTQLSEFNIQIIEDFCKMLGLKNKRCLSSDLGVSGKRSRKLLTICKTLGCDEYLSPVGAQQYIEEDNIFNDSDVRVSFQNYSPAPYSQKNLTEFVSHLSIVDVLANLGPEEARYYVETGNLSYECISKI